MRPMYNLFTEQQFSTNNQDNTNSHLTNSNTNSIGNIHHIVGLNPANARYEGLDYWALDSSDGTVILRAGSPAAPVCAAQIAALETRSNSNHRASDGPGLDVPALRLAPDSGCGFLQSAGFRRKRARFGRAVPVRHALAPGSVELWRRPCAPCITCVSVGKGAAATSSQANLH